MWLLPSRSDFPFDRCRGTRRKQGRGGVVKSTQQASGISTGVHALQHQVDNAARLSSVLCFYQTLRCLIKVDTETKRAHRRKTNIMRNIKQISGNRNGDTDIHSTRSRLSYLGKMFDMVSWSSRTLLTHVGAYNLDIIFKVCSTDKSCRISAVLLYYGGRAALTPQSIRQNLRRPEQNLPCRFQSFCLCSRVEPLDNGRID